MNINDSDNKLTLGELQARWLTPGSAVALNTYAAENGMSMEEVRLATQMTGRGYRKPETVDGWAKILSVILPIVRKQT